MLVTKITKTGCHQHTSSPTSVTNIDVTSHFEQHKGMVLGLFGCFTLVLKDTNKFDYSQFAILSLAIYPFSQGIHRPKFSQSCLDTHVR